MMAGYPAGIVLDSMINADADDLELRVVFDFDGAPDTEQVDVPDGAGPLRELLVKIAQLQELEKARAASARGYDRRLTVATITSRNAPTHKRVMTALRAWGITVDQAFFLGGMDKSPVLKIFRLHIVVEHQKLQLDGTVELAPCVQFPVHR